MTGSVVIGIGNDHRGDDGVGLVVVRALRDDAGIAAVENGGDPAELIEAWTGVEVAIVVDAARTPESPGTVRRIVLPVDDSAAEPASPPSVEIPDVGSRTGSHTLGLVDAMALGRALDRLPRRLVLYTVAGTHFALDPALSPPVAAAVPEVVRAIRRELTS
jgi:hydrogenase maturation protease